MDFYKNIQQNQDIKLSFGMRNNKVVCISELNENEKGLNCNCFCPNCGQALIARLGKIKQHHFAHKSVSCDLKVSQQTALHLLAKEIIEQEKRVNLPGISVSINEIPEMKYYKRRLLLPESLQYRKPHLLECDSVVLEKKVSDIVPDIIVKGKGRVCLIEIAVTHFVDNEKKNKIKQIGLPVLEIDLSKMRFDRLDRNKLKNIIVNELDNKKWVYNTKHDEALIWAKNEYKKTVDDHHEKILRRERRLRELRDKEFEKPCVYHVVPNQDSYDYKAKEQRILEQERQYQALYEEVKNADFNSTERIIDSMGNKWYKCKCCNAIKMDVSMVSYGGVEPQIGLCRECNRINEIQE